MTNKRNKGLNKVKDFVLRRWLLLWTYSP